MYTQGLQNFIALTRLNRPIGIFLLFWPCCWGLIIAKAPLYLYGIFFLGSILMRSAGCIVNDFFDRNLDVLVKRTKNRPLASGQVSSKEASFYLFALLSLSLLILIVFLPLICWIIGVIATVMLTLYPLMKRITFFPQLFLGFTFNIGILMGWFAVQDTLPLNVILLYLAGILWTLGYDTIYGFQDIEDDMLAGIKSASIYVKNYPKVFLSIVYSLFLLLLISISHQYIPIFIISLLLLTQIFTDLNSPKNALKSFKLNFWVGFLIIWVVL